MGGIDHILVSKGRLAVVLIVDCSSWDATQKVKAMVALAKVPVV